MKNYPSNITRQQFELIRPALENFRKRTKPRKYDLYEVFCAVLYVLKTGCQWRQVPGDFPEWRSVYNYYKIWSTKVYNAGEFAFIFLLKKP
ncbi:transposase, partial [Lentilactobacillus parabuchneri]|uniref:transposase n=1 Tax=Lentilactobacillus parabuchneri TaxID=152331 RepID=UPI00070E00C8